MEKEKYSNFRSAEIIKVIKVEVNEGDGTPEDPIVRVAYIVSIETGKVLAKIGELEDRKFSDGRDSMRVV